MRSSDWSSDVCASDLGGCLLLAAGSSDQQDANEQSNRRHGGSLPFRGNGAHQFLRGRSRRPVTQLWSTDRKSVVYGRRVSVRVALGGRRNLKKNMHSSHNLRIANKHLYQTKNR